MADYVIFNFINLDYQLQIYAESLVDNVHRSD
jgi:hypothetical protein